MGDCGAFNYVHEEEPPYSVDDVFDFYEECGFDYGISVDHIILAYLADSRAESCDEWKARQDLTLEYAAQFFRRHKREQPHFVPLGVAQGWNPASYTHAVRRLQRIGYRYIALGGMVPLKTTHILSCLNAVDGVRKPETRLHLLGITRTERVNEFSRYGVASLDSTSPFQQSFKDDRDNYHTLERNYMAVRVMQIDGNQRLKRRVLAGELDQNEGRRLELACLANLSAYDAGKASLEATLDALDAYQVFLGESPQRAEYEETLAAQPWKSCPCEVCTEVGIHVAIFRGTERNKRRGFHNLHVFNRRLQEELAVA
jgi:hypothetical protein